MISSEKTSSRNVLKLLRYDENTLVGQLGGILGLFLGASLLTAAELAELLLNLALAAALPRRASRHVTPQ